jgi:RHS repeat-associated protein
MLACPEHAGLPNRHESINEYRYGFQGQEKDDEIKGNNNSINYKYRMHDPRIGRFFAVDPLAPDYPHNSPYAFSENKVIQFIELEGLETAPIELNKVKPAIELMNEQKYNELNMMLWERDLIVPNRSILDNPPNFKNNMNEHNVNPNNILNDIENYNKAVEDYNQELVPYNINIMIENNNKMISNPGTEELSPLLPDKIELMDIEDDSELPPADLPI